MAKSQEHTLVLAVDDFTHEQLLQLHYGVGCLVKMIGGSKASYEVLSAPHVPLKTAKAKFPSRTWERVPRTEMVKIVKK